ncbi:MAG: hypothetical protein ACFFAN_19325 [Promethearchaeota archaeon]
MSSLACLTPFGTPISTISAETSFSLTSIMAASTRLYSGYIIIGLSLVFLLKSLAGPL